MRRHVTLPWRGDLTKSQSFRNPNATVSLGQTQLRGKTCEAFKFRYEGSVFVNKKTLRFYLTLICRRVRTGIRQPDTFQDRPRVIVKVISESTRRRRNGRETRRVFVD